jgi:hypothetical protein
MRLREIVPESWWKDLPRDSLAMMGYTDDGDIKDIEYSLEASVQDIRTQQLVSRPRGGQSLGL